MRFEYTYIAQLTTRFQYVLEKVVKHCPETSLDSYFIALLNPSFGLFRESGGFCTCIQRQVPIIHTHEFLGFRQDFMMCNEDWLFNAQIQRSKVEKY